MGTNSGTTTPDPFRVLQHRVAEVHWRWKVWKQLFRDSGEEGNRLMNSHAPSFFWLVERTLFDDIVMRLCKLVDPPKGGPPTARRTNLVLQWVFETAKTRLGTGARDVEKLLDELGRLTRTLRSWRNRAIAHEDERTTRRAEPLDSIPFGDIDRAISLAIEIMTGLEEEDQAFLYDTMIAAGDGDSLLQSLRWAEKHVQEATAQHRRP
jgi:hypothetical protein